jgi:glycosyltransferase involved in cell wall biosynthesis
METPDGLEASSIVHVEAATATALRADYLKYLYRAIRMCNAGKFTHIYASDALSTLPALICATIFGVRLVYHEHDAPGSGAGMDKLIVRWTRRRVARRAVVNIAPNDDRGRILAAETGCAASSLVVAMNCPLRAEAKAGSSGSDKREFRLYYHGTLNWSRFPVAVLHAMAKLPANVVLWIAGYEPAGRQSFVAELLGRASALGIGEGRIRSFGMMTKRTEMMQLCGSANLGLAFVPKDSDDVNLRSMAGASVKAFEYLAAGLPILVSALPEWERLYAERGVALACDPDNAEDIQSAIRTLMSDRAKCERMSARGVQLIAECWNYEKQFAPVLRALGFCPAVSHGT